MNDDQGFQIENIAESLRIAREYRGISQKDTAELLGISQSALRNFEKGKYFPSLPILESLSYLYHIPLHILVSPDKISEFINEPDAQQLRQLIEVRQHIISTTLQIAYEGSGLSQKDLAKRSGISRSKIRKYLGGAEIPLDDLKKLSSALSIEFSQHQDKDSQIGLWQTSQIGREKFISLPEKLQKFLVENENWEFLNIANTLYSLDKSELQSLANSLTQLHNLLDAKN